MKKPHEIKGANGLIIVDLAAYSMIFTDANKLRLGVPIGDKTDSVIFPTKEAAAAEFARIRAALFGEDQLQPCYSDL